MGEVKVRIRQGRMQNKNDFIKDGSLQISKLQDCNELLQVKKLTRAEETWNGYMDHVMCLQITLDKPQHEWIAIREIVLEREPQAPTKGTFLQPKLGSEALDGLQNASPHASHYALHHAFEAAIVGFLSGGLAWLAIWHLGKKYGVIRSVGCVAPWTLIFMTLLAMSSFLLPKPNQPTARKTLPVSDSSTTRKSDPCQNGMSREKLPIDWRMLRPGISFLEKTRLKHLGPGKDPRDGPWLKRQMSIGVIAQPDMNAESVASSVLQLVERGAGDVTVALLVGQTSNGQRRQEFIQKLHKLVGEGGDLLHLLDPSRDLYPEVLPRSENVDLALLSFFLEPLSDAFMVVEPNCVLIKDFPRHIKRFTDYLEAESIPWIVVEFSGQGHTRKLLRSRLLPRLQEAWLAYRYLGLLRCEYSPSNAMRYMNSLRFNFSMNCAHTSLASLGLHQSSIFRGCKQRSRNHFASDEEMLVMFPDIPAASLFWDFIDVVGNETAPKSIYLGISAAKKMCAGADLQ